jgi:cell division protein FtsB
MYAVSTLKGPHGLPALAEKRRHISVLQEENATLAAENQRRQERLKKLETDRELQELVARERLGVIGKGETKFIVPNKSGTSAAAPENK